MLRIILYTLFAAYFAAFGVFSTVWPEKVRAFYIRQYMSVLGGVKNLFDPAILEKLFPRVSVFRFLGITSLLASILITYFLFRG